MYEIKEVIENMKKISAIKSNTELANFFNVSYNTFNTWIKRKKFPQEILLYFCKKFDCSLDYLLFNKENPTTLFEHSNVSLNEEESLIYYGEYKDLNIKVGTKLVLKSALFHSGGYYILTKNSVYTIAKCNFNLFDSLVKIDENGTIYNIDFNEFKSINRGLITNI